jgi:hypothetical protein
MFANSKSDCVIGLGISLQRAEESRCFFNIFVARMCTCMDWAAGVAARGTITAILPTIIRGVILQEGSLVSHFLVTAHVGHAGVPILLSIEFCWDCVSSSLPVDRPLRQSQQKHLSMCTPWLHLLCCWRQRLAHGVAFAFSLHDESGPGFVTPSVAPSLHGTVVFMACDDFFYTLTSCTNCTFGIICKGQFYMVFKLYNCMFPGRFVSESGPCHRHVPQQLMSLYGPCIGLLLFPM